MCYAIDINGVIDMEYPNCKLIKDDVEELLKDYKLQTLFDLIYMRQFLHTMPYNKSKNIFKYAIDNLKPNGLICIEVKSSNDKSYETTPHELLYTTETCKKLATDYDCDILYCEEDYFSPNINTETHNPLLIRIICKKKLLPYYINSENYSKYKHILPKKKKRTMATYKEMDKINLIFEKHNIKYVATDGTVLGLNRHGGIIPWDDDIDIGFIDSEWEKLFTIKKELRKNGFKYRSHGRGHCHFGTIDCFKLSPETNKNKKEKDKEKEKKKESYEGVLKTYCSIDEYMNVAKQIFGYTYIYAPFSSKTSLSRRYGNYFYEGDVNDNFHFRDKSVKRFKLNKYDLSYQLE